jgi:hypothetical protein
MPACHLDESASSGIGAAAKPGAGDDGVNVKLSGETVPPDTIMVIA